MSQRLHNISKVLNKQNRIIQLRNSSKINKQELLNTLIPQKINKHFDEVFNMIRNNSDIFQHPDIEELTKDQQRQLGTKQALKIMKTLKINLQEDQYKFLSANYSLAFFGISQSIKGLTHYLLYIKTILLFKNNYYHQECLRRAEKLQDIGSFNLTQLHHGSFSRGIATQAVYDHTTKQFVLNSHGEKGMKFWIGNSALTANKTVMWAQLIVDGINYGPHVFILQIRDEKNHKVLPGIIIGDCGPKNGLNGIDNGYTMLKDVRIPSKALLGKLGQIDSNGKYISKVKTNSKRFGLHMSPLSNGRALITFTTLSQSSAALAIALRYACQRRQFKANQNEDQRLIIDYPITRYRLLNPLAMNTVSYFTAFYINNLYIENSQNLADPSKKIVTQLHAASAVLKAKLSWFTNSVITECRQVLAGHGYSSFSGLGRYYHDNDINATWEGDNNMLLQQTSKYLLKTIKMKQQNYIINLQFVYDGVQGGQIQQKTLNNLQQLRTLLQDVFIHRYNTAVKEMSRYRQDFKKNGVKSQDIQNQVWNNVQPYFCNQMALSYGDLIIFNCAYKAITQFKQTQYNKQFLITCLRVWAQSTLLKASIDGLNTRKALQRLILEGCQAIYPDCIAVSDILAPPSYIMGSPFGKQDGEGMKDYINLLFTAKKTFGRVPWFGRLIQLRQNI